MKKITYWLMLYQLYKAEQSIKNETNNIVLKAKKHRIDVYKSTLILLNI